LKPRLPGHATLLAQTGAQKISVIGGGEIIPPGNGVADELLITEVQAEIDGDTVFPALDSRVWQQVSLTGPVRMEKDSHSVRFGIWRRRER
jgi:dihydrofolate reductase